MDNITQEGLNKAGYKYYAFISYNHKDEEWAKKLQSKLRRYRLPSVVRTEVGGDVRIDPVFRYRTNLPVAHLRDQIKDELERSKYLIVICSPNSAKPNIRGEHWVNDEVTRFAELGRADRIVPVIVDGVPNSGDARECFCPVLRTTEISAVNLSEGSRLDRKHEFLRLVAKLLGLDPAQLIREDKEDERHERTKKVLCRLPLILLSLVGGVFAWDALRPVENYYANYVDSYGLPEGLFPLAEGELHGRHIHYRFEYGGIRFGKSIHADSSDWSFLRLFGCQRILRRVVQSNSVGCPCGWEHTEYLDRSPILEFEKYEDGVLRRVVCRAPGGTFKRRLVFSDSENAVNGIVELKGEKTSQAIMESAAVTAGGMLGSLQVGNVAGRSEIAQYQLKRDGRGRMIERRFKDVMGYKFVSDSEGVYGFSHKLDEKGRTEELWYLDANGDRRENKRGVAGRKYHYVGRNMDRSEYVNVSGTPTLGHFGWMVCIDEFDAFDNNTCSRYYDAEGRKMTVEAGFAEVRNEFDARGNVTAERYYGTDGKPCLHKDGYAEARLEYDARGNKTAARYYGTDGNPCLHRDGNAGWIAEYDVRGLRIRETEIGLDGKPMLNKMGFAEIRLEYDARGNMTMARCYGLDGKPCRNKEGSSGWIAEYDVRGLRIRETEIGMDGKPTLVKDGYAECRCEYDARGNWTAIRYCGTDGKPCLHRDGNAGWIAEYDVRGQEVRKVWIGVDGKPTLVKDGYAESRLEYDARGNKTAVRYYGTDGKPCLHRDGNAGWIAEYDVRGQEVRKVWIGVDGKPTLFKDGYAESRCEYDVRGNITAVRYYGTDGNPCLQTNGISGLIAEYDMRDRVVRSVLIGVDGKPTLVKDGYAEVRFEYDARGNKTAMRYFDTNGKPVLMGGLYAACTWKYNDCDKMIDTAFFNEKMERVQVVAVSFVAEVAAGSQASAVDVRVGDVVCEFGNYRLREDGDLRGLTDSIREFARKKKRLVTARKVGDAYKTLTFDFPAGIIGVRFDERRFGGQEFGKIRQAYRDYLDKDK